MDLHKQVLNFVDFKDVVSLEVIQHEKVKLVFGTSPDLGPITAELHSPGCLDDMPCSRLSHSVIHTDNQSFLSLSVHSPETDHRKIFVTGVLGLLAVFLLFIWLFRKWKMFKQSHMEHCHDQEDDAKINEKLNEDVIESSGLMNGNSKCDISNHQHPSDHDQPVQRDAQQVMMTRHQHWLTRVPSWCMYTTLLVVGGLFVMQVMLNGSHKYSTVDVSVLKVSIPQSTHVRHIRSYSEDPDIKDIQLGEGEGPALVTRLQLLDLSPECRSNLTECRAHALCDTDGPDGNVRCRCNRGFYLKDLTCTECKTTCPDGFYMTQQCGGEKDMVCKACTQCEGTSYEVAVCTSTQDTMCIDVTFPLKRYQSRITSPEELVSINVTLSKNVFLERLQKLKKLETQLYIPNNRQELEFVWGRPSGLEIQVKVSKMYLIPEYVDVDMKDFDDLKFVLQDKGFPQDIKDQLKRVVRQNCRHPLPDQYDLILNMARKTTTAAMEMTCDSKNRKLPCPHGYDDGDTYIFEQLGTACSKLPNDTNTPFRVHYNNILCSGNTDLLKNVFDLTVDKTTYLRFPSDECQGYQRDCSRCLSQRACIWGSNSSDCCNLACHGRQSCQRLYSSTCPVAPVECARGDVSKFSIMPRYPSIMNKFSCHLRHLPPQNLYLLAYEARIKGKKFTFGERRKEVKYKNLTDFQHGTEKMDYLTLTHHTEDKYSDEVILIGKFNKTNARNRVQVKDYMLHKLKKSWEFDRSKQYTISNSKAKIQFVEPFLFTTKSWSRGGCAKNVSQIVPLQPIYQRFGINIPKRDKKEKNKDGKFVYQLLSANTTPHIRFTMPENISIMSYYKDDFNSSHLKPSSLKGQMVWDNNAQIWKVTITGSVTVCPGYFTLEIFTDNTGIRLAIYDMLILCPQTFSIVFNIRRDSVEFADKFIVVLNDTISSYNIIVSSVQGPQFFRSAFSSPVSMETINPSPWIPVIVIITICLCASTILFVIYLNCEKQKSKHIPTDIALPKPDLGAQITLLKNQSIDVPKNKKTFSSQTKMIMLTMSALYVVYTVLFTFTALFGMLHLIQGSSLSSLTLVSNTSAKIQSQMQEKLQKMVEYENRETAKLLKATDQRLKACSNHLKLSIYESLPDLNTEMEKKLMRIFRDNGTVQELLGRYFTNRHEIYQRAISGFVDEFNRTLDKGLHKIQTNYTSYLKDVANNKWFSFPKEIFTEQQRMFGVTDNLAGFLTWLEIDKIQEIIEIKDILMNRLLTMIPKLDFSKLLNDTDEEDKIVAIHLNFSLSENWFRLMSAPPPDGYYGYKQNKSKVNSHNHRKNVFLDKNMTASAYEGKVTNIKGIVYPVFISVFLVLDFLLLLYRFSWLKKSLRIFKHGIEQRVPYDSITRKVYFILTGKDVPRLEDSLDHPYDYYINNKENIWGDKTELYFLYCQASSPKSKEEILKDLWSYKQQQKPNLETNEKKEKNFMHYCVRLSKLAYRLLISPVFWRLILICGFLLFVCLVTKATDDLVTMESAVFLLDTEAMLPIFTLQNDITNTVITQYGDYLNNFISQYKQVLDAEVQDLNTMMVQVAQQQSVLLNTLISDMCNLAGAGGACSDTVNIVTMSLTSCNFLPLQIQPYTGFHEQMLENFIQAELSPLVMNIRGILFSTLNLLLTFAAVMMICQILARVIFVHLQKSRHVRTTKIYQLPSTVDQWSDPQSFHEKEVYASRSVIAESCESGVYDMTS